MHSNHYTHQMMTIHASQSEMTYSEAHVEQLLQQPRPHLWSIVRFHRHWYIRSLKHTTTCMFSVSLLYNYSVLTTSVVVKDLRLKDKKTSTRTWGSRTRTRTWGPRTRTRTWGPRNCKLSPQGQKLSSRTTTLSYSEEWLTCWHMSVSNIWHQ